MHRLAEGLKRHAAVDLFARTWAVEREAPGAEAALGIFDSVHLETGGVPIGLPGWTPSRVRAATPWALRAALEDAHAKSPYDAVVVSHVYAWATAARLRGVPTVLDEHNVESHYQRAVYPAQRLEAMRLARWERRVWPSPTLVTCVSDDDIAMVRAVRSGPVELLPNGVDLGVVPYRAPSTRDRHEVIFVGAMSHPPNIDAAVTLATHVFPRVRARVPDATLVLCGRAPAPEVRALAGDGITVTGTVPSVLPYLARASVYACPLQAGAGTSLKVPEALAAGLPLVSTGVGVRGLDLVDGHSYRRAETWDAMADAIVQTWRDDDRDRRAERARAALDGLDWNLLGERLWGWIDALRGRA